MQKNLRPDGAMQQDWLKSNDRAFLGSTPEPIATIRRDSGDPAP
jgi:hypothetical protein